MAARRSHRDRRADGHRDRVRPGAALQDDRLRPVAWAAGACGREVRALGRARPDGQGDGEIEPLCRYVQVSASHWIVPLVPTPPGVFPLSSVKKTAVQVAGLGVGDLDVRVVGEALRQRVARVGAARIVERNVEERGLARESG